MSLPTDIRKIVDTLNQTRESEHFILHFGLRNPRTGPGLGPDGVRDTTLILTYFHALEALYNTLRSKPWEREPPVVGKDGKTHVYVFDSSPITSYDSQKMPFIILPSRSNEPTTQAELYRAASEAVHEATHLFNYSKRPFYDLRSEPWEWFDEGLAVLMEMIVAAGNPDYFRFLMDWIDSPQMPVNDPDSKYQAGMFIRYLSKRLGLEFINDVWQNSEPGEGPLEALTRLMPAGETLVSSDPEVRDLFASGYCIDPYFLWEHASVSLAPDVYVRFGERAVSESLMLPDDSGKTVEGALDHLACRYYRFYLRPSVQALTLTLDCENACDVTPLKAEVAVVTNDRRRLLVSPLRPHDGHPHGGDGRGKLTCVLDNLDPDAVNHVVLVVSNCGTRSSLNSPAGENDDNKRFFINAASR
ncbi:MAG: DUF6055 domain-containing protein [Pyrinomonadaceae bacterium]